MTLAGLLPALHGLAKSEKLRALQVLAADEGLHARGHPASMVGALIRPGHG